MRTRALPKSSLFAIALLVSPVAVDAQEGIGFRYSMGWQDMGGDYGTVLDGATSADFTILYGLPNIRLGAGANYVSFAMDDVEETWNQIMGHFLVAYPFELSSRVTGYVEGRLAYRRLRPEEDRFINDTEELLSDFVASASGFELVAGIEVPMSPRWALEASGAFGRFTTDVDLSSQGLGPIDSGNSWRLHAGVTWFPTAEVWR